MGEVGNGKRHPIGSDSIPASVHRRAVPSQPWAFQNEQASVDMVLIDENSAQ